MKDKNIRIMKKLIIITSLFLFSIYSLQGQSIKYLKSDLDEFCSSQFKYFFDGRSYAGYVYIKDYNIDADDKTFTITGELSYYGYIGVEAISDFSIKIRVKNDGKISVYFKKSNAFGTEWESREETYSSGTKFFPYILKYIR